MNEKPLADRLADAIQTHHETTLVLQGLAAELVDHCARMRTMTDRLQANLATVDTPGVMRLPRVLASGPRVVEEAQG